MDCEQALRWLALRFEGELLECEQSATASVHNEYWRGRIASTQEALKFVHGVLRRLEVTDND